MTGPTAAKGSFPYAGHRSMAEVMAAECKALAADRARYDRERRSLAVAA